MTQEEILEYNKRCAEFLGETKQPYEFSKFGKINTKGDWVDTFFVNELKFHSDWKWIIEVVEAIEKIKEVRDFIICSTGCVIFHKEKPFSSYVEDKKEAVVEAINQFLIWYNETKS